MRCQVTLLAHMNLNANSKIIWSFSATHRERHIKISCFLRRKLAGNKLAPQTRALYYSEDMHKILYEHLDFCSTFFAFLVEKSKSSTPSKLIM